MNNRTGMTSTGLDRVISLRSRLFYQAMRVFFRFLMPKNMSLATYRKASSQPLFERMPRGISWEASEVNGIPGEWITPSNANTKQMLLYLHGGGYVLSTPHVHRVLVGRLARAVGCRAFMPEYSLAPEHPFPAAIEDILTAYRGLLKMGYSARQIVVAGDSAGGGLAMALLISLRDTGDSLPTAACLISAMLDCTFSDSAIPELQKADPFLRLTDISNMAKHYYGIHNPHNPLISPIFDDLHGLPPLLVYAGEHEILNPESIRFAEKAHDVGVDVTYKIWAGMIHAFPLFAGFIPEGKIAIEEISIFFRRYLHNT
jgi:epsilon-lactone hydrolase